MEQSNILQLQNINKRYGSQVVLKDVSLDFFSGQIHMILGENGCGKSTLVKIIAGVEKPDSGAMLYNGEPVAKDRLSGSVGFKAETVFQSVNLFDNMTVAENIFIRDLPSRSGKFGFVDYKAMRSKYEQSAVLTRMHIPDDAYVGKLPYVKKRLVEITKAMVSNPDILILDEPLERFTEEDTRLFYDILRGFADQNKTVIMVTHKIEQALKLSDRISVIRDGVVSDTINAMDVEEHDLLKLISGKELKKRYPKIYAEKGAPVLTFDHVSGGEVKDISFSVHHGEILGITGFMGSGKSSISKLVIGSHKIESGRLMTENEAMKNPSPGSMLKRGFGCIAEDSATNLIPTLMPSGNITLSNIEKVSRFGFMDLKQETVVRDYFFKLFSIPSEQKYIAINALSGGTLQKLCISKSLFSNIKMLILDEPTLGLDSGSKSDVYNFMIDFVGKGNAVLLISSDFDEIAGMCDRAIILNDGMITKILNHTDLSKEQIVAFASR